MRFTRLFIFLSATCLLLCCALRDATAQGEAHHHRHRKSDGSQVNCFDSSDPSEIRLWEGRSPGAVGDDPCRDVPFLRIYTPKVYTPSKSAARTAIIIIPGGGYDRLTDRKEQAPVGEYFSQQLHVTAFVLYYRLVQSDGTYRYPVPIWDGQRAVRLIRYRAAQYGLSPNSIGLFGFSAGGHLASTLSLHSATDFDLPQHDKVDTANGRPDFLGLGYPVVSMLPDQFASPNSLKHLLAGYRGRELEHLERYLSGQDNVTPHTPPVFLFESMDDAKISPENSVLFARALQRTGIPADVHLFSHGLHGSGLAEDVPEEKEWPAMFHSWLIHQGYLNVAGSSTPGIYSERPGVPSRDWKPR
jgi:acetyl esterase/lipase